MTTMAALGDVLTPRSGDVIDASESYPIAGVYGFGRGLLLRESIKGSETKYRSFVRLASGNVIYSKVKAFEGAVAVVPPEGEGRYVSPEFPVFTLDEAVEGAFLKHYLASEDFLAELRSTSSGIGARRERVHPSAFLNMRIPMPAMAEQRRIAAHLDRLALIPTATQIALPHRRALARAIKNSIIQKAEGRNFQLVDLLKMTTGETVVDDARYRMTGVYSFGRGLLNRGVIAGSETKYKTLTELRTGNVVYSKLGAFENAVAMVDEAFDGSFVSPEFPVFEVSPDVNPEFLGAALTTSNFAEALGAATSGVGARQKRVSPTAFLSLSVRVPDRRVQGHLAETLATVQRSNDLMQRTATLAASLVSAARNEIFSAMR